MLSGDVLEVAAVEERTGASLSRTVRLPNLPDGPGVHGPEITELRFDGVFESSGSYQESPREPTATFLEIVFQESAP